MALAPMPATPQSAAIAPLIVSVECNTPALDFLPKRALWEAAHRSGMGRLGTFKTLGWRDAGDTIYQPNAMVRIEDDFLGIHESLLVSGVKLSLDESGKMTELKCSRLSGFVPAPIADLGPYENSGAAQ